MRFLTCLFQIGQSRLMRIKFAVNELHSKSGSHRMNKCIKWGGDLHSKVNSTTIKDFLHWTAYALLMALHLITDYAP